MFSVLHKEKMNFFQNFLVSEALPTVNFQNFQNGKTDFERIKAQSKDFPLMVMEFWSGWFDHWGEEHHGRPENCKYIKVNEWQSAFIQVQLNKLFCTEVKSVVTYIYIYQHLGKKTII